MAARPATNTRRRPPAATFGHAEAVRPGRVFDEASQGSPAGDLGPRGAHVALPRHPAHKLGTAQDAFAGCPGFVPAAHSTWINGM